ncbi:hypothetical protein N0B44_06130 [Roseibacterium beibuensis]|nr:hypothetical protein [Roseibacterium beibuensis]MCS6622482.1 hypothetical protein [Roseibacterium beibuensis]
MADINGSVIVVVIVIIVIIIVIIVVIIVVVVVIVVIIIVVVVVIIIVVVVVVIIVVVFIVIIVVVFIVFIVIVFIVVVILFDERRQHLTIFGVEELAFQPVAIGLDLVAVILDVDLDPFVALRGEVRDDGIDHLLVDGKGRTGTKDKRGGGHGKHMLAVHEGISRSVSLVLANLNGPLLVRLTGGTSPSHCHGV